MKKISPELIAILNNDKNKIIDDLVIFLRITQIYTNGN
jgi:hypothetical protein